MSYNDALKKYGNDVTKIPGWSGRNPDGKIKTKVKPDSKILKRGKKKAK